MALYNPAKLIRLSPDDLESLDEASNFKQKTFLSNKHERNLFGKLASGDLEIHEVLQKNFTSANGNLVKNLEEHIDERFENDDENFPSC